MFEGFPGGAGTVPTILIGFIVFRLREDFLMAANFRGFLFLGCLFSSLGLASSRDVVNTSLVLC